MVDTPFLVLTRKGADLIRRAPADSGELRLHFSKVDELYVVNRVGISSSTFSAVDIPSQYAGLRQGAGDSPSFLGQWFRSSDPDLAALHFALKRRLEAFVEFDVFKKLLPGASDPGGNAGIVIVQHGGLPGDETFPSPEFTGWMITRDGVFPAELEVEPNLLGPIQLASDKAWPLHDLAETTVTIVGAGSIGSAAALSLAELGVGQLNLVDYDRLLWHNVIRHRLGPDSVGRYKVNALKTLLDSRAREYSQAGRTEVAAYRMSAVEQADILFELALASDVLLCCADGIAPRRAVNHVGRLAGVPSVFACVLGDGRVGEIFRSRPGRTFGCLQCHRAWLASQGAIDPETDQEAGYGTGTTHKPMTAVPHDLALTGAFAAKVTMATLLESRFGDSSQRLPGEHAVLGLRPDTPLRWPYSVSRAGDVVWNEIPPPRPDCATCSAA